LLPLPQCIYMKFIDSWSLLASNYIKNLLALLMQLTSGLLGEFAIVLSLSSFPDLPFFPPQDYHPRPSAQPPSNAKAHLNPMISTFEALPINPIETERVLAEIRANPETFFRLPPGLEKAGGAFVTILTVSIWRWKEEIEISRGFMISD